MENEKSTLDVESVSSLSDEDLFKHLKKNGLKCGPITATTRYLYEKRLKQFLDPSLIEKENQTEQQVEENTEHQSVPEQKSVPESVTQDEVETISRENVEEIPHNVPIETKRDEKDQVESKVTVTPISTSIYNETDLNKSTDSTVSSSDNYLNISGIRGRAPLRRQNESLNNQNSTSQNGSNSKKSIFVYFVLALVLAFSIYTILIFLMDQDENSVEL